MPAHRKPEAARQDNRSDRQRLLPEPAPGSSLAELPPAPAGIGGTALAAWVNFWSSKVGEAQEPVDLIVAHRWVLVLDEWHKAMDAIRDETPGVEGHGRFGYGSMGQLVANPLMQWAKSLANELHSLEQQLGIGLRHRSDLGVAVGQARLTAAELAEKAQADSGADGPPAIDAEEAELLEEFEDG